MPNAFAPFDYGQVVGNVEAIKGARTRNALAQQQMNPNSPQNQLMQAQLTGAQQGNVLAQQQGKRAQGTFDQQQRRANSEFAYEAFTVMSQNPEAVNYYGPKLKEMGIIPPETDWSNATPEETMSFAAKQSQALGQALGVASSSDLPSDVQSTKWLLDQDEATRNLHFKNKRQNQMLNLGSGYQPVNPVTNRPEGAMIPKELAPEKEIDYLKSAEAAKEGAKLKSQLKWKPVIMAAVKKSELQAKEQGETFTDLSRAEAAMPGLNETVAELKDLASIATSTLGGRAWDQIVQQTGFGATDGATAQAKFIAIVNNQVLPLLKPTFGAAFTVQEGESLKATMGDPNATPEAKMAQLDAFIQQKYRDIRTKKAQLGAGSKTPEGAVDNDPLGLRR